MPKARPKKKLTTPIVGQTDQSSTSLGEKAKDAARSALPVKTTRAKKSGYVDGLGYEEKTGTYHAHGRAVGTFTRDTKQKDYDKAPVLIENSSQ